MKRNSLTAVLLACFIIVAPNLWAADQPAKSTAKWSEWVTVENYIIGPGDILDISVWNNEALTKLVTVLPDGKIFFPLIGEVVVGGKTISFVRKEMEDRLTPFVPNPNLSVLVHQLNSMWIYVIGKVNNPGRFALNINVKILQALAMAGGLNAFAKRDKIKIFRETQKGTAIFKFDYDDVTEGKNLNQNIRLKRGDVVVVP